MQNKLVRHLGCLVLWQLVNKSFCSGLWYVPNLFHGVRSARNPQAFMSEESSEGQQSSAALNITTSGGPPSSSVNMANFQIPPPGILELNDGALASNWRTWVAAWKNYTLATKLDKEEEARQVATLLAVIGKEANTR